jgi:hypothetical protein
MCASRPSTIATIKVSSTCVYHRARSVADHHPSCEPVRIVSNFGEVGAKPMATSHSFSPGTVVRNACGLSPALQSPSRSEHCGTCVVFSPISNVTSSSPMAARIRSSTGLKAIPRSSHLLASW